MHIKNQIWNGDCVKIMQAHIPSESVDLVFADPPFNVGKKYDSYDDNQINYREWCEKWIIECVRVLKEGGEFYIWQIPRNAYWICYLLEKHNLTFQNWIAVNITTRITPKNQLRPFHYSLIRFSKGEVKTFNSDDLLSPHRICGYCKKNITDWGGKEKFRDPKGVRLSDVWFDIKLINHTKHKKRSENELPLSLIERIILLSSNETDLILDPFMGAGATIEGCLINNRSYIGIDISTNSYKIVKKRIKNITAQKKMGAWV